MLSEPPGPNDYLEQASYPSNCFHQDGGHSIVLHWLSTLEEPHSSKVLMLDSYYEMLVSASLSHMHITILRL